MANRPQVKFGETNRRCAESSLTVIYTPSYGGNPIFGLAVKIDQKPDPGAAQIEAFFGVPGQISLFAGARGRTFRVSGVLFDVDLDSVAADELVFLPNTPVTYVDGIARELIDTYGRAWENVIYLGPYSRTSEPRPAVWGSDNGPVGGWEIPYQTVFRGLG
jgi:hypothetical protein